MKSTFLFSTTFNTKYNHELRYLNVGKIRYFPDMCSFNVFQVQLVLLKSDIGLIY